MEENQLAKRLAEKDRIINELRAEIGRLNKVINGCNTVKMKNPYFQEGPLDND